MSNPGGQGLYMPFNAWGWIFASLTIGLGLWTVTQKGNLTFSTLQKGLWMGAFLLLLPMLYPGFELKAHALPRLLGLMAGLLFLFCLYQWPLSRSGRDKWLHLLLGAVALEALLGLVQFYLLEPGNWMGYDTKSNRPHGIFQQPNVMATFMATGLALASWLQLRNDGQVWLKALRYGVVLAASLLLTALQSRVGMLGGLLALLLLAPQLLRQRQWMIFVLVALGVAIALGFSPEDTTQRGLEIYQSGGIRVLYWAHAANLIAQAPWAGWGYGAFEITFLNEYATKMMLQPQLSPIAENVDHPHNEFLYWAVEGGMAAMLGFLLMAAVLLWRVFQAGLLKGMGLLALLTPILLHTQTEYPLYHAVALWWALLLLVHVMDAEVEEDRQASGLGSWKESVYQPKSLMRLAAVLLPLVVVPFMLSAIHTAWLVTEFERNGRSEIHLLQKIVNPLPWQSRVEHNVFTLQLQEGLLKRDPEQLESYLNWAQGHVRHTPRARIYANMAMALQAMDRTREAQDVQALGLRLYPGNPGLSKALAVGAESGKSAKTPSL
ncbi:Wzy polymerase domain-containing protein [Limnohabitans sp.]|uniref:PglL family O-oligosaccharyltransferase n=1 Tax=Limnohabitans sp. TaxID=1907725 RepID=UPI0037C0BEA1